MPTTVVHLVDEFSVHPPESLEVPKRMGALGRGIFAAAAVIATVAAVFGIFLLWTSDTPGWWFSLLFTVFVGGIPVVLWALFIGSLQEAGTDRDDARAWREHREHAVRRAGHVRERHANLTEDGAVAAFDLTIEADGDVLMGSWRPHTSNGYLLQPQLPGRGARVQIWTATENAPAPGIIEVTDPTVVAREAS